MSVTLSTLIQTTPFKEETRQQLLADIPKMTEEQKFYLSESCWEILSQSYFFQLRLAQEKLVQESASGVHKFNKQDFDDLANNLSQELCQKLKTSITSESLSEVRSELQRHLKKPAGN